FTQAFVALGSQLEGKILLWKRSRLSEGEILRTEADLGWLVASKTLSPEKKFSYEPERIADDLYAIPVPLHDGSPVNAYVAIGDDGLWLIDGGLMEERSQGVLASGIAALGCDFPRDTRGILVTHVLIDHAGAAQAVLANGGEL